MRNRFDQLGKQIGKQALGASGMTVAHDEISPNAQHADLRHEPDSGRKAERAQLGLLGRLASVLCLIELYGHAPGEEEVLACVGKLIAFRQKRARGFRRKRAYLARGQKQAEGDIKPFLWIIAAGRPDAVLSGLRCSRAPGWPAGVYFSPQMLRVGVVVGRELPRERSTLLVRLMAGGPLLSQAIEELRALPAGAPERAVAEQILLDLKHVLGKKPGLAPEEREFMATMHDTWEKAREEGRKEGHQQGRKEGHQQGRKEGRAEEAARAVLKVLQVRGLRVSKAARERILAQKDPKRLERWLERAIIARSASEVLEEPN